MRHHNANRKLKRERKGRRALLRTLAVSMIQREKITTTEAKARELRPYVEKLVSRGKNDTVAARRIVASRLGRNASSDKLFKVIGPKFKERAGGYTRIIKLPRRQSDGSKMATIEFV